MAAIAPIANQPIPQRQPTPASSGLRGVIEKISEIILSRWALVIATALLTGACFGLMVGLPVGLVGALIASSIPKKGGEVQEPAPAPASAGAPAPVVPAPAGVVHAAPVPVSRERNIAIFNETLEMIREGVRVNPERHRRMLASAAVVQPIAARGRPPANPFATQWIVEPVTTYEMAHRLVQQRYRPFVLDMANLYQRGGGVQHGAQAQEETLCRQSNLYPALERIAYPLPSEGGAYIEGVQFFRDDAYNVVEPFVADVFVSAAYNCNRRHGAGYDRPEQDEFYVTGTEAKIRTQLRKAIQTGHPDLVLSAFGCGAFQNPPGEMAEIYRRVLNEPEFRGAFRTIAFGIYDPPGARAPNYPIFRDVLLRA